LNGSKIVKQLLNKLFFIIFFHSFLKYIIIGTLITLLKMYVFCCCLFIKPITKLHKDVQQYYKLLLEPFTL